MEENKKEETVVVSEQTMEAINKEITQVETNKIEEAKKEGAESIKKEVLPSLEEIKKRQDELERKIALKELEEKERLLKELESKPVHRKGIVPESSNPVRVETTKQEVPQMSNADAWATMASMSQSGQFRAVSDKK